ncbi:MAG: hypothetical protein H6740_14225 [Alphaproteobacteria bacterium]|nr:hypothetical protein [Alphaproteobacteria bacterium]
MIDDLKQLGRPELAPLRETLRAFSTEPGALTPRARLALMREASAVARGSEGEDVPFGIVDSLRFYVRKVSRFAYRVVDEDIDALKARGLSEDVIYEATIAASLGASLTRLERGLSLLGDTPDDGA